jgi:hypothetical protein
MPEANLETGPSARARPERYARAFAMLREWIVESELEDEGGYDWEAIEAELNNSAMVCLDR